MRDLGLDLVEYLAILISPSPKDTMKAIDHRRALAERDKVRRGEIDKTDADHKLFKKDHRGDELDTMERKQECRVGWIDNKNCEDVGVTR